MCGGQQENATRNQRNGTSRRRRQNLHPDSGDERDEPEQYDAVDKSPAVFQLSEGWRQCSLIPRTPQHLVTLIARNPTTYTWSAPPILWKERYLIAPTLSGRILIWDLSKTMKSTLVESEDPKLEDGDGQRFSDRPLDADVSEFRIQSNHTPDFILDTEENGESGSTLANGTAILQICIGSSSILGNGKEVLVSISVAGFVHIFNLDLAKLNLTTAAASFSTGKSGIQCVTTTTKGTIVIGYRSGRLEAWKAEARKVVKKASAPESKETTYRKKLLWRGFYVHAPEIRSLLQLRHPITDGGAATENETPSVVPDDMLILTIQQEEMISTAGMIEVVNITAVQKAYQELLQNNESATEVGLEEFALLARPGMEVVNPTTTSVSESEANFDFRNRPWAPNGGTDSLVRIELPLQSDSMLACAAILAEGSVLLITTYLADGELEWGIRRASDQLLLSFPAMGVGYSLQTSDEDTVANIVCCLRGGTSYHIACDSDEQTETANTINVITYPHDIDTDNPPHRVNFFSAGVVRYPAEDRKFTKSSIPVMVYCWPGGIMDVYASELLQEKRTYMNAVLAELVSDGTVQLFREHLLSLNEEKLALREDDYWRLAREEVMKMTFSDPILLSDLLSTRLRSFRSILVSQEI